ncbi:MAG: hypothetical protein ACM3TR_13190 [Caulobacteraceae bacterium]
MKKIIALSLAAMVMVASSVTVFADNAVSNMAVAQGGKQVAACAREMNKGVSKCAKLAECNE